MAIGHLQAEQVDQPQFAGDPHATGYGMQAASFFCGESTARVGPVHHQEAFVVLNRLTNQCVGNPVTGSGLGQFFCGHVHGWGNCASVNAQPEVAAGGFDAMRLREAIVAGASGGSGITSAAIEAARAAGRPRAIGWRTEADGAMAFRLAAPGDVDLDGMVDILDVSALIAADLFDGGGTASWGDGDFNADGGFDILDVSDLVAADLFDHGPYDAVGSAAAVAVPEPAVPLAGSAVVAVACLVAARIRRRISLTAARSRRRITLAAA